MNLLKKRTRNFLRNVEANFGGGKVCKRSAYNFAYYLLTFAYMPVYCPAYLPATGKAGRSSITPIRLVLWVENILRYNASLFVFQNQIEVNHNG